MNTKTERKSPLKVILKTLFCVIFVLVFAAAVLLIIPVTETPDTTAVEGSADWMAKLPDSIGINEITLPGTHDSASCFVQLGFVTKCQSLGIGSQLEAGFRYLDIRLGAEDGQLSLYHGFASCKTGESPLAEKLYLDNVLEQCYTFLENHPTETVVFAVKQEHGSQSVAEFETMLNSHISENPEFWLNSDTLPTLGEARGKLVLMRRYNDDAAIGAAAGIPLLWENQDGCNDVSKNTAENDNGSYTLWVQDRYEYGTADKWTAFSGGMKAPDASSVVISFLSTKGTLPAGHPYYFAQKLNPQLMESEELCGWVIIDFGSAPLAEHIYSMNFGG